MWTERRRGVVFYLIVTCEIRVDRGMLNIRARKLSLSKYDKGTFTFPGKSMCFVQQLHLISRVVNLLTVRLPEWWLDHSPRVQWVGEVSGQGLILCCIILRPRELVFLVSNQGYPGTRVDRYPNMATALLTADGTSRALRFLHFECTVVGRCRPTLLPHVCSQLSTLFLADSLDQRWLNAVKVNTWLHCLFIIYSCRKCHHHALFRQNTRQLGVLFTSHRVRTHQVMLRNKCIIQLTALCITRAQGQLTRAINYSLRRLHWRPSEYCMKSISVRRPTRLLVMWLRCRWLLWPPASIESIGQTAVQRLCSAPLAS